MAAEQGETSNVALPGIQAARDAMSAGRDLTVNNYGTAALPTSVSRSAYLEQVRRIAPPGLRDRDSEMAELARFCLAPQVPAYAWWRAGPWAGKSALLSTFVLSPPEEVAARTRIVSFFITARLAAQDTRQAFTEVLAGQLAELSGQTLPAVLPNAVRESYLLDLLAQAAAACQEAGGRLVLVIDGLDEDRGVTIGPHAQSIAGWLPANPPSGMRVIVAGRPDPPIPDDVPDWHPLRDPAIVRPLSASPHARDMQRLGRQELLGLLQGPSLGQDLTGLLAAARGGLSGPDLAELTGAPLWDVEAVLNSAAGRAFTRRAARWTPGGETYLLGHEELQAAATRYLSARLPGYKDRLHSWADRYRGNKWPANTPEYLLDGYHQLLKSAGELIKMVDHATDRARQARMRDVSGGDNMALRQISASLDALNDRAEPDIYAIARLAMHRDTIADRNRHIPASLPGLWADLGNTARAEALARSLSDAYSRAHALRHLAQVLNSAGHHGRALEASEEAMQSIRAISDDRSHHVSGSIVVSLLVSMVRVLRDLDADDLARSALSAAEVAARANDENGDEASRARAMVEVAQALQEIGDHQRALAMLNQAETLALAPAVSWFGRASALATVTLALAEAGHHDRAVAAVYAALDTIGAIPDNWHSSVSESIYITVLIDAAKALDRVGNRDRALALLHQAETTARAIVTGDSRRGAQTLADLARAWEALGARHRASALLDHAEIVARAPIDREERAHGLADFGLAVHEFGDHDRALKILIEAEELAIAERDASGWRDATSWVAWALIRIASRLERSGDHRPALLVLGRAESLARSAADGRGQQADLLTSVAELLLRLDDRQRAAAIAAEAESIASRVTDSNRLARTLADLVSALATAGDQERAAAAARQVDTIANSTRNPYELEALLGMAARVLTVAGDHDRAEVLAYSIGSPESQIRTMAEMAWLLYSSGDRDRASALARRADAIAASTSIPFWELSVFTSVVRALATIGDHGRAEIIARSIVDPGEQARALATLAGTFIAAGELGRAEALAYSIPDPDEGREPAPADLDWMLASRARFQAVAAKIEALTRLARAMTANGDHERALTVVRTAENLANANPGDQTACNLARALAAIGAQSRAETLADGVADLDGKAEILLNIAKEVGPVEARRLLTTALALGRWTMALGMLARIAPQAIAAISDEYLATISSTLSTGTQDAVPETSPRPS